MTPVFVCITTAGAVWVASSLQDAQSIAGATIFNVCSLVHKQQIASITNASAVVPTNLSGAYNQIL